MAVFYTYVWLRIDGTPYYVGKGKEDRGFTSTNHRLKCPPKERIVIYPAESEAEAFENEVALIWYYGRKDLGTGCLRNLTEGGEGAAGWVPSEETRRKISRATKGRAPSSSSGKVGTDNHMYGIHISDKQKEAIRNSNLGNTHSAGTRNHTIPHSEGTKTLLAAKVKALWADPVYRERMKNRKVRGKGKHNAIPI